jgi:DNA-binding response OmpR family regulator
MKRLLLVDDDAVLTRAYRDLLSAHGFQVATAASGAGALSLLKSAKPDLVVLDLMMPELTGVDVLKFVRGQPRLAATPVVVLANELQDDLGRHAGRIGIQKAFRKDQCSPTVLMAAIDEILEPMALAAASPSKSETDLGTSTELVIDLGTSPESVIDPGTSTESVADPGTSSDAPPAEATSTAGPNDMVQDGTEESRGEARASFLADAPAMCAELGELSVALSHESLTGPEQQDHLQDLLLKVRFLAETADLAGLEVLAQATAAFDGLLTVLMENPQPLAPSVLRTVESFVGLLCEQARESGGGTPLSARVLVVDDDPVANEMVVAALRGAQLDAHSTEDSLSAWQWINSEHFDLVLLKIEMPVLNGLQLCECLRTVAGYEKTSVVLVAANDDLDTRATSALLGADDLIVKPILPQELAVRVLTRLVRGQIQPASCPVGQIRDRCPESAELADDRLQIN